MHPHTELTTKCTNHALCSTPASACANKKEAELKSLIEQNAIKRSLQASYPA